MDTDFSKENINQYKQATKTRFLRRAVKTDVALAIFDKNHDKKISTPELNSISKEQYGAYIESLKTDESYKDEVFVDYDDLKNFLDCDGIITANELEGKTKTYGLKGQNLDENKSLKDVTQMSQNEILEELSSYGIRTSEKNSTQELKNILNSIREERSNYDINSDITDGHIGTFVQGNNAMCTFLSLIETMSDEQIKELYTQKTDKDGNVYYEVTFPQDKASGKSVIVTQEELNNKAINIEENGKTREVVGFSTGDTDVTMLEMAYTKRFGTDLFDNGGWINVTKNNVMGSPDSEFVANRNLENIKDFSKIPHNTTISALKVEDIFEKGIMMQTELQDGRFANISASKIFISDGTEINMGHAMSVRGFDKNTNELIISGNSFNSSTETRIPIELMKYFEMSLPKDFQA